MCWVNERMEKILRHCSSITFHFCLPKHKFKSYFFTVPNDTSDFKMSFKGTNSKSNDLSNSLNGFYEILIKFD